MLMLLPESDADVLGFLASGKLTDNDYKKFLIPEVKQALDQHAQVRLLFLMDNFLGWELQAAWDDLIFGLEINRRVERIAIVGDQAWESWMARLARPFSHGEIRYFDQDQLRDAWRWAQEREALATTPSQAP